MDILTKIQEIKNNTKDKAQSSHRKKRKQTFDIRTDFSMNTPLKTNDRAHLPSPVAVFKNNSAGKLTTFNLIALDDDLLIGHHEDQSVEPNSLEVYSSIPNCSQTQSINKKTYNSEYDPGKNIFMSVSILSNKNKITANTINSEETKTNTPSRIQFPHKKKRKQTFEVRIDDSINTHGKYETIYIPSEIHLPNNNLYNKPIITHDILLTENVKSRILDRSETLNSYSDDSHVSLSKNLNPTNNLDNYHQSSLIVIEKNHDTSNFISPSNDETINKMVHIQSTYKNTNNKLQCSYKNKRKQTFKIKIDDPEIITSETYEQKAPVNSFQQNETDIPKHSFGPINILCVHCEAKHFVCEKIASERKSCNDSCDWCHEKIVLDPSPHSPLVLKKSFESIHEKLNHFHEYICLYDRSFSFPSFNADLVRFQNRQADPFCIKIQDQIYYQIGNSLYLANNDMLAYKQLSIVDPQEAMDYRPDYITRLDSEIFQAVNNVMRRHNSFAQTYQMIKEELDTMTTVNNDIESELQLIFTVKKELGGGRFNFQQQNKFEAIFSTTAVPKSHLSIRNRSTKNSQYISSMNENVEDWT